MQINNPSDHFPVALLLTLGFPVVSLAIFDRIWRRRMRAAASLLGADIGLFGALRLSLGDYELQIDRYRGYGSAFLFRISVVLKQSLPSIMIETEGFHSLKMELDRPRFAIKREQDLGASKLFISAETDQGSQFWAATKCLPSILKFLADRPCSRAAYFKVGQLCLPLKKVCCVQLHGIDEDAMRDPRQLQQGVELLRSVLDECV